MDATNTTASQLLDIIGPSTPPESINYGSILIIAVAISVTVIMILFKLHRSGFKYKVLMSLLGRELTSSNVTPKQAAYKLAGILQSAHNTHRLATIDIGITETQKKNWQTFLTQLSDYRYAAHEVEQPDMLRLINHAKAWTVRSRHRHD